MYLSASRKQDNQYRFDLNPKCNSGGAPRSNPYNALKEYQTKRDTNMEDQSLILEDYSTTRDPETINPTLYQYSESNKAPRGDPNKSKNPIQETTQGFHPAVIPYVS